ncbi:hypothetical protein [Pseudolactococcus piscium]|uniref:hypothetical protein n=1 Tax=Pseudolactococcus piscium TaxID=1364 RepID=UPI000BDE5D6C|nr:hypothetical protein [Lactococcus piscium]
MTIEKYRILYYEDIIKELENDECMFFLEIQNCEIVRRVYKKVHKGFGGKHKVVYYNFTKSMMNFNDINVYFQSEDCEQELINCKETDKINKVDWIKNNTRYIVFKYKISI